MSFKRIVVSLIIVALATAPANAITMKEIFDGANTNVTVGGAVQGQAMNYYTGGSLFIRTPRKNYQLLNMTPPSFRGSACGGLDMFLGGLSHISAPEFVDMLKKVGTGVVQGFAFKLAMKAMSPEVAQTIEELQALAQKINKMNIDSCEIASGIVNAPDSVGANRSALNLSAMGEAFTGITDSFGQAIDRISHAGPDAGKKVFNSLLPAGKITDGNITWQAINRIPDNYFPDKSTDYKHLLMSMIGPIIITPKTNAEDPGIAEGDAAFDVVDEKFPIQNTIADLLGTAGSVQLMVYVCDEPSKCKNPTPTMVTFDSFQQMVHDRMTNIVNNILNETTTDQNKDIAFVNSTPIPVYKMLSVATQMKNGAMADYLIGKYEEAIAAEFAAAYLSEALKEVRSALSDASAKSSSAVKKANLEKLGNRANELRKEVSVELGGVYSRLSSVNHIAMEVMSLERALSASLPSDLRKSLQFQQSLGG